MHFQLCLSNLFGTVIYVKNFGIAIGDSFMMHCYIEISFIRHSLLLSFFSLLLLMLIILISFSLQSIFLNLSQQVIIYICNLILCFVFQMPSRCIVDLIVMTILGIYFGVYGAVIELSIFTILNYLKFIL